ncbi:hypothetical protein D3C85_159830 [compost metagenome]
MPLPSVPVAKAPDVPNIKKHQETYQSPVVDTRQVSYDTLATFPAGQRWDVDFYNQVQGRDNAAASYQEDLLAALQQLHLIRGFELVVTQPLNHSQSPDDSRGWESTGSSMVYSVMTPNLGDIFIADIGNGTSALFQITETKRNTIYNESGTEITYRATKNITAEVMEGLKKKTVATFYFDRENMRNGIKALIREEEVDVIRRLGRAYERLAHLFLRDFFSTEFKTLIVPGQQVPTYDPYMVRFIKATMDSRSFPKVLQITELGVQHDVFSNQVSLFDAIMRMDISLLSSVSKYAGISDINSFRARPMMNSIYFSGIKQVVTFQDVPFSVDSVGLLAHGQELFTEAGVRTSDMDVLLPNLDMTHGTTIDAKETPLTRSVLTDRCYILTDEFYEDGTNKTILERLLFDRLDTETSNLQDLLRVAEAAPRFDNLDRFYYIPVILALIKLAPGVL